MLLGLLALGALAGWLIARGQVQGDIDAALFVQALQGRKRA